MTAYENAREAIPKGLAGHLGVKVIRGNQTAPAPAYDYVSYNVITPVAEFGGTYSEAEDGSYYRAILQTWSFTVHSDDDSRAVALGMKMLDYFTAAGLTQLADSGVTVRRVTGLTQRDNFITTQYEYRKGLDVTFGLLHTITPENMPFDDVIETAEIKEE